MALPLIETPIRVDGMLYSTLPPRFEHTVQWEAGSLPGTVDLNQSVPGYDRLYRAVGQQKRLPPKVYAATDIARI